MRRLRFVCLRLAAVVGLSALAGLPVRSAPLCPGLAGVAPPPPELQAKVAKAFGVAPDAARNSLVRCVGDRLLACSVGANLNCGAADARKILPGATDYCQANPTSDFIPMYATGHATIYNWRCAGGKAVPGKTVVTVDPQGYAAQNWREIR